MSRYSPDDIHARVEIDANGCWLWRGYVDANGYGRIGKNDYAHRESFKLFIGDIPEGSHLDHVKGCPKHCCNPYTLTPVSPAANRALVFRRKTGQMPRRTLRVARWLHKRVAS